MLTAQKVYVLRQYSRERWGNAGERPENTKVIIDVYRKNEQKQNFVNLRRASKVILCRHETTVLHIDGANYFITFNY